MMNKLLILTTLALFLTACGGSISSTNSANSNAVKNANSNSANNQATTTSAETTPITMDNDGFKKADMKTLENYKGRTLIVKGAEVIKWSESAINLKPAMSRFVQCNGDLSSYKDSIKSWENATTKPDIYADVKGTVSEVEDRSDIIIKLENCNLLKLDK